MAVHHDVAPGAAERAVVSVGEADIEGKVVLAPRIHPLERDGVEPFRRPPVALPALRAEATRIAADRIGLEQIEAAVVLRLPDLELGFGLEDPDEDRRFLGHSLLGETGLGP